MHPFGRAKEGLAQHLPEEGEGGGDFLVQGFDAEGEFRDHAVRFQGFGGFDLGGESAGVAGELFVELDVVEGAGAEFGEAAAVEGEEGEVPGVEVADIEEEVDVEDAGGSEGVGENRDAGDGVDVEGRIGGEVVDVVEAEPGEGFESLGAVGDGLKAVHGVDKLLVAGFGFGFAGEFGGEFGDAGGFVGEFAGLEGGVGADDDDGAGGVFEEVCPDPVGKEGGFFLPADAEGADAGFHLQGVEGIAAVDPDVEGLEHGDEAFGGAAGVLFAEVEFGAVEGAFDEVGPESVAGNGFEAFEEEVDDGVLAAGFDPAEAVGGGGLEEVGVDGAAEEVLAEAAFEEGDAEGAGGIAGEEVVDHVGEQEFVEVEAGAGKEPVHGGEHALVVVFAGGVGSFEAAGLGPGGLEGDGGRNGSGPGAGEKRVEFVEALEGIVVAVEVDKGVGGVIVIAVKLLKGLEGEVGDVRGGAAVVEAVEAVGEEGLLADVLPAAVGAGVDAFHFVVDDTLEFVAAARAFLKAPALLAENGGGEAGKEDGVEIDIHQVIKVGGIATGDRIAGAVGIGEGVEIGLQGGFEEFFEGLFDGVFFAAAEHGVLEDVRESGVVGPRGAEGDAEDFVVVGTDQGEHFGAGAVFVKEAFGVLEGKGSVLDEGEGGMLRGKHGGGYTRKGDNRQWGIFLIFSGFWDCLCGAGWGRVGQGVKQCRMNYNSLSPVQAGVPPRLWGSMCIRWTRKNG